jgi:hypothetical protein
MFRGDAEFVRDPHQLSQRLRAHVAHNLSTVDLDRGLAELQVSGDLLFSLVTKLTVCAAMATPPLPQTAA